MPRALRSGRPLTLDTSAAATSSVEPRGESAAAATASSPRARPRLPVVDGTRASRSPAAESPLGRRRFFREDERSAEGWSALVRDGRDWESFYRDRWQHDRVVRSTHGVNCTGSCSWKVHVKDGIVAWETQQTDYPSNGPDVPEYEPRGCPRGASFSWYVYSPLRVRYPYVRGVLLDLYREALARTGDPVEAWADIVEDPAKARSYKSLRGKGGFVRASWDEVAELVAAAHVHTIRRYGPDRVRRLLADSRDVDGLVRRRDALPLPDRRRLPQLLRLVRRPPARLAADLGRPDRRPGVGRLVELRLRDPLGLEHPADPHARRALHDRGALPRAEGRRRLARLRGPHEVRRPLAARAGGHRRRARDGDGARDPEGDLRRAAGAVLPALRAREHRPPVPRHARGARRRDRRRTLPARLRPRRAERERRLEDRRPRHRDRRAGRPARLDRLPLGRRGQGQVEPRARRDRAGADAARQPRRARRGRPAALRPRRRGRRRLAPPRRAREADRRDARDHRLRPDGCAARRAPRRAARRVAGRLRRPAAVHARVAGGAHRRRRRPRHPRRARVRPQRRAHERALDDRDGRRHEPLVPLRPDLPGDAQPRAALRLPGRERRRLGALRRPGEGPPDHGLVDARVRARLEPAAAPAGDDAVLVPRERAVALPADAGRRVRLAARPRHAQGDAPRRLLRARRAARLDALVPELRPQPARPRPTRPRPRASRRRSTSCAS